MIPADLIERIRQTAIRARAAGNDSAAAEAVGLLGRVAELQAEVRDRRATAAAGS